MPPCPDCKDASVTAKWLRNEIRHMQLIAETKNKELDAMHWVWCDGGCKGGTHRWTDAKLTEEIVLLAERNTRRMRSYYTNHRWKNGEATYWEVWRARVRWKIADLKYWISGKR